MFLVIKKMIPWIVGWLVGRLIRKRINRDLDKAILAQEERRTIKGEGSVV